MWQGEFDTGSTHSSRNHDQRGPNSGGLLTAGLAVVLAALVASMLPAPLVAPVMRELLLLSAFGAVFVAVLRQDRLFADEFTAWDQAAMLAFIGLLCGLFVDPEAVSEALNEMTGVTGTAPA